MMKMSDYIEHILKSGDYDEFKCEFHGTYLVRKDIADKRCPYIKYKKPDEEENKRCQEK